MGDACHRYFCPRLLDYLVIVGSRHPNRNNSVAQTPEMLRRYPLEDHKDFPLAPDVVFFCQPEGCISIGPKRMSLRETTSFVFTLTEKDTGKTRYGICVNFFRPIERRGTSADKRQHPHERSPSPYAAERSNLNVAVRDTPLRSPRSQRKQKTAGRIRNNTLTSLCIISHHPFFSTFRECLFILKKLIESCNERCSSRRIGASRSSRNLDTVWSMLSGINPSDATANLIMHEVREIETWILRLLSAPVPVPGKTRVEVTVLPEELHAPLVFALPDHTRFSLVDFPLHLPLELLGVETCLRVLMLILLEHKIILQSRDYNALSMSVMAFVAMLYPLEYMFPVIPLLPTCMSSAEQILLAPTPFIIGVPASFLMYKHNFALPDDVWLVDLDSNKINMPTGCETLPPLPEPEGTVLKNHLKQIIDLGSLWYEYMLTSDKCIALASMSMTPQPIKNLDSLAENPELNPDLWKRRESFSSATGFNPLIYGNDVDSVDVATRVAMARFFNSPNVLGNFTEHTRTLRLYPRPVVAFQLNSFMKSRPVKTAFTHRLARTQAVEYFVEWALSPTNVAFLRVQTGVFDPLLVGDKAKWFSNGLQKIDFRVFDEATSTLGAAVAAYLNKKEEDDNPTDESGSDSDGAESTSSSYSSLSDFVIDMQNSDINGDTPENYSSPTVTYSEDQLLTVDESRVYSPPSKLHVPDMPISNSDSALSAPDSEVDSSASSSPIYAEEPERVRPDPDDPEAVAIARQCEGEHFRYDDVPASPGRAGSPLRRYDDQVTPTARDGQFRHPSQGPYSPKTDGQHSPKAAVEMYPQEYSPRRLQNSPKALQRQQTAPVTSAGYSRPDSKGRIPPPVPPPPQSPSLRSTDSAYSSMATRTPTPPGPRRAESLRSHTSQASSTSGPKPPRPASIDVPQHERKTGEESDSDKSPSIISEISSELKDYAQTASNTLSELLGIAAGSTGNSSKTPKNTKPFAPLGNRIALVEKSGLVKHATSRKPQKEFHRQPSVEAKQNTHSENQQFLKDIVNSVLEGQGVGFWKLNRVKKLMEDENYRNFIVSRLNKNLDRKLSDEDMHIEDVPVSKAVFKGMQTVAKALVCGLEYTYHNQGVGGMSSAIMLMEILHTHYWEKDNFGSGKSDTSNQSVPSSPFGSRESLSSLAADSTTGKPAEGNAKPQNRNVQDVDPMVPSLGSPVIVNGDEFENIELRKSSDVNRYDNWQAQQQQQQHRSTNQSSVRSNGRSNGEGEVDKNDNKKTQTQEFLELSRNIANLALGHTTSSSDSEKAQKESSGYGSESGDMLRDLVVNKDLSQQGSRKKDLPRYSSLDSDVSEGSTLMNFARKKRSHSILSAKSHLSTGYRYHGGKMLNLNVPVSPDSTKVYLFEMLIGKDRSWLWDQMQFWEDVFLDAVAQERDIIGMDQGPGEMMDRYNSLSDSDKKRLEQDEDRILGVLLYYMIAFMVMLRVSKNELRRKVRRLLGKSHIGLAYSYDINTLLDQINNLHGNDIDLKPMPSRLMQKHSFTVHWGPDNTGDMLFMEVCDDCIILRSVTGAICDRWWYEKLVNMTYCPKTKVLCLWRKNGDKTQLNKFYTKKCKDLYFCVKEAMERAAARNSGKVPGPELGGEFPVQDMRTGQGGLLQVCMEGIGLLFANSKLFIELSRIKKCFTLKGGIFVLEEFDPKTRKVTQRKFRSNMANLVVLAFHRVITQHPGLYAPPSRGVSRRNSEVSSSGVTEDAGVDMTESPKETLPDSKRQPDENCNVATQLSDAIIKLENKSISKKDTEKWVQSIQVHITGPNEPATTNGPTQIPLDNDEGFPQEDQNMSSET